MGSVKLNNSYSMHGEQRLNSALDLVWPLRIHVGGKPSGIGAPPEILFLSGLTGCTFSMEVLIIDSTLYFNN